MNTKKLYFLHLLYILLPLTRAYKFKRILLRWAGATVGRNVRILSSARFYINGKLTIGNNTWLGADLLITGGEANVSIGENVDIGPRVSIVTGTHKLYTTPGKAAGGGLSKEVKIEGGAWIGAGAIILGGVNIGKEAIVGAGALVRKDVGAGEVVGGNPAKLLTTKGAILNE